MQKVSTKYVAVEMPSLATEASAASADSNWYALRVIGSVSYTTEYLSREGVEIYSTPVVPRIIFVRTDVRSVNELSRALYGKAIFYRNPDRTAPQEIDDRQMKTFIAVTSTPDADIIQLDIPDPEFFIGQRVRVTGGIFEGAEGVVKRIKGDRRLLIHISGVCVVATPFIHPSLLTPIDNS